MERRRRATRNARIDPSTSPHHNVLTVPLQTRDQVIDLIDPLLWIHSHQILKEGSMPSKQGVFNAIALAVQETSEQSKFSGISR